MSSNDAEMGDDIHSNTEHADDDSLRNYITPIRTVYVGTSTDHVTAMGPTNRNSSTDTFESMVEVDDDVAAVARLPPSFYEQTHVSPNVNYLAPYNSPNKELPSDHVPEPPDSSGELKLPAAAQDRTNVQHVQHPNPVADPLLDHLVGIQDASHNELPVLQPQETEDLQEYLQDELEESPVPSPEPMDLDDSVKVEYLEGEPNYNDVPFGRGHYVNQHIGHKDYLEDVKSLQPRYNQTSTDKQKRAIVHEMIDSVAARGGRFVKKDANGWFIVPNTSKRVYDKVRQSLKDKHTKEDRKQKRQKYSKNSKEKRQNKRG